MANNAIPSVHSITEPSALYGSLRPCVPHRYSGPYGFSHLDVSLAIGTAGSHVPYESLVRARAVFTPDAAQSENQVILRACPGRMGSPRFRRHLIRFRRFCDGLLTLAFPHPACRDHVPAFLQRSPPSLLTKAACSGLKPAPDRRLRGAHPHLSYSIAPPCVGTFVTPPRSRHTEGFDQPSPFTDSEFSTTSGSGHRHPARLASSSTGLISPLRSVSGRNCCVRKMETWAMCGFAPI